MFRIDLEESSLVPASDRSHVLGFLDYQVGIEPIGTLKSAYHIRKED